MRHKTRQKHNRKAKREDLLFGISYKKRKRKRKRKEERKRKRKQKVFGRPMRDLNPRPSD